MRTRDQSQIPSLACQERWSLHCEQFYGKGTPSSSLHWVQGKQLPSPSLILLICTWTKTAVCTKLVQILNDVSYEKKSRNVCEASKWHNSQFYCNGLGKTCITFLHKFPRTSSFSARSSWTGVGCVQSPRQAGCFYLFLLTSVHSWEVGVVFCFFLWCTGSGLTVGAPVGRRGLSSITFPPSQSRITEHKCNRQTRPFGDWGLCRPQHMALSREGEQPCAQTYSPTSEDHVG